MLPISKLSLALRAFALAGLTAVVPSCTASLELDRFRQAEAPIEAINVNYFDVKFTAKAMESHINEVLEIRIVDKANRVQAKAIYKDVTNPDFTIYLGSIVPKLNAPYRIDWWADHNNSFKYDGIEGGINDKDHAWRRELRDPLPEDMRLNGKRYELEFIHDTAFTDIATDVEGNKIPFEDQLLFCDLTVAGAGAHLGKMLELRVADKRSGRLVGLFREGRVTETFKAPIPGILDEETAYEVSIYVDANGSGGYDASDPSWKTEFLSTENGITLALNLATLPQAPITTGEK